jgi:poly(3-hydroxybutyrate) depolymerase
LTPGTIVGIGAWRRDAPRRRTVPERVPALINDDVCPEDRPFVVVAPQNDAVDACPTVDDIESFLSFAIDHYDVDEARVYLTGTSCGAVGARDYLAAHEDEVVAEPCCSPNPASTPSSRRAAISVVFRPGHSTATPTTVVPTWTIADPISELQACTDPPATDVPAR